MPYSIKKPDELPENVQKLPANKRAQWVEVFNSAYAKCKEDGGEDCEATAFAQANGVALKRAMPKWVTRTWFSVRNLFSPHAPVEEPPRIERALDMGRLYQRIGEALRAAGNPAVDGHGEYAVPIDLFHEAGQVFLIYANRGRLYRTDITIAEDDNVTLGESIEVTQTYKPVSTERSRLMVLRDGAGRARWLMVADTAVLNRVGEIDSMRLFDSFERNAKMLGMPYLTFFHAGKSLRLGEADYVARDGVVYLATGMFDDTPLARAAANGLEMQSGEWGSSVWFLPLAPPKMVEVIRGVHIPVYEEGWNEEISVLPEKQAAAWFTVIQTAKEVVRMRQDVKDALAKLVGAELADKFAALDDEINNTVRTSGLVTRENGEAAPVAAEATTTPEASTPPAQTPAEAAPVVAAETQPEAVSPVVELDEEVIQSIVAVFEESPAFQALAQGIAALSAQFGTLQQQSAAVARSVDAVAGRLDAVERAAEEDNNQRIVDTPRQSARQLRVTYRARQAHQPQGDGNSVPAEADLASTASNTLAGMRLPKPLGR